MSNNENQLDNFFMSPRGQGENDKKRSRATLAEILPSKDQLRHLPKVFSKKERYAFIILALIALVSLIVIPIDTYYHFTKSAPAYGNSFSEGMVGTPKYINPLLAQTSDVDRDLSGLIYSGLMKYDDKGQIDYGLAQSYNISSDGLTYTFKLKDNLLWQDGQPIAVEDIIFTIQTIQNPDYGSFQRINWQGVDVSKINDKTVVFKLKNKYAQFIDNMTLGIMPKHIWDGLKPSAFGLSEFNIKPVGSGPYKFSKITKDSLGNIKSFELGSFDKYYSGKPYISKITFRFYRSEDEMILAFNNNQIDELSFISPQKLDQIRFAGRLKINKLNLPRYFAMFFNQNKSQSLSDKNVRLALSNATDKKEILHKILSDNGSIVDSPMLPGIINLPDNSIKYDFDIAKAKKTLDDGGWNYSEQDKVREKTATPAKKGKKQTTPEITKLEIGLTTSDWPELVAVANQVKKQWESVGIKVNLRILPLPELQQTIKDRDYEVLLFGEVLGLDPDPFSFWHSSQKRDPGLNLALYDNKSVDKIIEDARQTLDRSDRLAKYNDFQKAVTNDAPAIFLYSPYYLYAQTTKIKNNNTEVISIPSDRFANINKWYINTGRVGR